MQIRTLRYVLGGKGYAKMVALHMHNIINIYGACQNLKFKSLPTVAFFAAVNHNLNTVCLHAINGPWKT